MAHGTVDESTFKEISISDKEFRLLRNLIYERSGIDLSERKRGLLVTRLSKLLKRLQIKSFSDYYDHVTNDKNKEDFLNMLDAISTNHTSFFREKAHFDYLYSTVLPEITGRLRAKGDQDIRVWCSASSSGEEPYTICMMLMEALRMEYSQWQAGLLATDISRSVLATAKNGIYREERLELVPPALKKRYFRNLGDGSFQVVPQLRDEITFRLFNLMNERFPFRKPFHVIFCRNVLIYFDQKTVEKLIRKMYQNLVPGGYLFVGHSESLARIRNPFEQNVYPAVYRRSGSI